MDAQSDSKPSRNDNTALLAAIGARVRTERAKRTERNRPIRTAVRSAVKRARMKSGEAQAPAPSTTSRD